MPLAATQHTSEGARAFAEFFIKTIDWGFATQNSAYIRHFTQPSCQGCFGFADKIDKDRTAGLRYLGGRFTVRRVSLEPSTPAGESATVTVDGSSREVMTAGGRFVTGDPAYPALKLSVTMRWISNSWIAASLAVRL